MGGGTSKFDVTDWARASGELQSSQQTIDGSPPTSEYKIITLIKRGMNQREFDIVDEKQNLLYTTRPVPGTLAWFDVLGPTSCGTYEDLLLRIQVDLARRTWMVYRYNTPVFEGQRPANLDPVLYKSACITVSWSRYVAVAARYGPPSIEYLFHLDPEENSAPTVTSESTEEEPDFHPQILRTVSSDSHDDFFSAAVLVAARRREESQTVAQDGVMPSSSSEQDFRSSTVKQVFTNAVDSCSSGCPNIKYDKESPVCSWHDPSTLDQNISEAKLNLSAADWVAREERRKAAYQEAMEGIVNVDGPLIECQEIYNKIIGNHQTQLICKEQARRLLQWDDAQHMQLMNDDGVQKVEDRNPFVEAIHEEEKYQTSPDISQTTKKKALVDTCHESSNIGQGRPLSLSPQLVPTPLPPGDTNDFEASLANIVAKQQSSNPLKSWLTGWGSSTTMPLSPKPSTKSKRALEVEAMLASLPVHGMSSAAASHESSVEETVTVASNPLSPEQNAEIPDLVDDDDNVQQLLTSKIATSSQMGGEAMGENVAAKPNVEIQVPTTPEEQSPKEALIGYWSWKNTYTVHKIEMHLAKDSDLALHVVMAILCNQVRSERNALAMTV